MGVALKSTIISLILFLSTSNFVFAQPSGWYWQNPLPQGNTLHCVMFVSLNIGWAVGENGTILRTTNGGTTWTLQTSGTTSILSGVSFTDSDNGIAVGGDGTILRTTNGGIDWNIQLSGTTENLFSISFSDVNNGTAVGSNGTILRTTNGGADWISQSSGTTWVLCGVSFSDANNGTAVGQLGTVLRTSNGGAIWTSQSSGTTDILACVAFIDSINGTAVGHWGTIITTTNGGISWITRTSGTTEWLRGVSYSDINNGTAVGWNDTILKTTDGGVTWNAQTSGTSEHFNSVSFTDANNGTAVGSNGIIFRTMNGGTTWTAQSNIHTDLLFSTSFSDSNNGTAVGGWFGTILRTNNGGITWEEQISGTTEMLNGVSFSDDNNGTVVGGNTILRTTDGGLTWIAQSGATGNFNDVLFINSNIGTVVGDRGIIFRTTNGGSTWTPQTSGTNETLEDVSFSDSNHGTAVGGFGTILRTTNGGATWTPQLSDTTEFLYGVSFSDTNNGFVVGYNGTILRTTNGGLNWIVQTSGTTTWLWDVCSSDANNAIAVGSDGTILKTTNGGATWTQQISGTINNLYGVSYIDNNTSTVVGWGGTILRTETGGVLETKIYGYAKYGESEIPMANEIIKLYVQSSSSGWDIYDTDTTDENGYYEFSDLTANQYRLSPTHNPNYYFPVIYDGERSYANSINVTENQIYRRDVRYTRSIKILSPENNSVNNLHIQIQWKSIPFCNQYRVQIVETLYPNKTVFNIVTTDTSAIFEISSEFGVMDLVIDGLDQHGNILGKGRYHRFYIVNSIAGGTINQSTTWSGGVLIKSDVIIENNVTLTINPGTTVFFDTLDQAGNPGMFSILVNGKLVAQGNDLEPIIFFSYILPYNKYKWDRISFNNSDESSLTHSQFFMSSSTLEIINSNVELISNSFSSANTAILFDGTNINSQINNCYFSRNMDSESFIKIKNNALPTFSNCNFFQPIFNSNYVIELENTTDDIFINDSWMSPEYFGSWIYDKHDDPSLGEVIFNPPIGDPGNLTPGAENIILNTNPSNTEFNKGNNVIQYDPHSGLDRLIGFEDGLTYFLNGDNSIILDMGINGDIINGDSVDIRIVSESYSNNHSISNLVDIYLSNDTTSNWEMLGFLGDDVSLDISGLNNQSYRYVKIANLSSLISSEDSIGVFLDAVISLHDSAFAVSVENYDDNANVVNYTLTQNYPNPFNPTTTINYSLPNETQVRIFIYNILGEKVTTLLDEIKMGGNHKISWDASSLPSGIYFYQLVTSEFTKAKKMVLLK